MKAKLFFLVIILTVLCYSGIAYAGEEITLTTYYPAPYGEYEGLAVGDPNNGYTAPADPIDLIVEGNVGIGTTGPGANLEIEDTTGTHLLKLSADDRNPYLLTLNQKTDAQEFGYWIETDDKLILQDITDARSVMTWDGDGNVGIGTTSPETKLHIVNEGAGAYATLSTFRDHTLAGGLIIRHARGTEGSLTALIDGDYSGVVYLMGYDGNSFENMAFFGAEVDGDVSDGDTPGKLFFATTPDGSKDSVKRMVIDNQGNVGIGTAGPGQKLEVNGNIKSQNDNPIMQQLVHKRIIFGYAGDTGLAYSNTWTTVRGTIYGPFGYAVPAVQSGATRKFRLYAIYSDSMTTSGENRVWFDLNDGTNRYFNLGRTWGGVGAENRDGYSDWYTGSRSGSHGNVKIQTTLAASGKLWYLELQTWDFFE